MSWIAEVGDRLKVIKRRPQGAREEVGAILTVEKLTEGKVWTSITDERHRLAMKAYQDGRWVFDQGNESLKLLPRHTRKRVSLQKISGK